MENQQIMSAKYTVLMLRLRPNERYKDFGGGALALWLERRTPDRETRVRSSAGSVCCFLEQETFTPQKYW